jgi:N-acetyl-gamma-glutamyl-phosphate reductase
MNIGSVSTCPQDKSVAVDLLLDVSCLAMATRVFVDGQAGTTGLKIQAHLEQRQDLQLLSIADDKRKDTAERARLINEADVVFLCLPDDAAKESVSLVRSGNINTRILDASTAHRTHPEWAYGIPELSAKHRTDIQASRRVAVPGCHASGFCLAVYPLVSNGILPKDYPLTCQSLTGYSGGGKQMIATWEDPACRERTRAARPYALSMSHKHLPEMQVTCGLSNPPVFQPVVFDYFNGMVVSVPLHTRALRPNTTAATIQSVLSKHYAGSRFVEVMAYDPQPTVDDGYLDPTAVNGTNRAQIFVFGDDTRVNVCVRLDNLGKGASGAAVQCMNLMLGLDEGSGL